MAKACISREFHIAVCSWLMNRWLMPYDYKDEVRSMINHAMLNFFCFFFQFSLKEVNTVISKIEIISLLQ